MDVELERVEALGHVRVVVPAHALDFLLGGCLGDLEDEGGLTETQVLSRNKAVQENVDACQSENE